MTLENYFWYSKAVLGSITLITILGILLRWQTETKMRRPLAYMCFGLMLCCILDLVLCANYEYHPLMLKSGSNFGSLFFALIITAYSYLYTIEVFSPRKLTLKFFLQLNCLIIFFAIAYALFALLGFENLPSYDLTHLVASMTTNPFASLWLLMAIVVIANAIYVNLYTLNVIYTHMRYCNRSGVQHNVHKRNWSLVTYSLFSLIIPLGFTFFLMKLDIASESLCFLVISLVLILLYVFSHFQKVLNIESQPIENVEEAVEAEGVQHGDASDDVHIRVADQLLIEQLAILMDCEHLYQMTDMTTDMLAQNLNISRKKLYLFLKKHYNASFSDYINGYRLTHAEKLMTDKKNLELTIDQIAEMSGFSSIKTFNKFFKEKHSITPSKFRDNITF